MREVSELISSSRSNPWLQLPEQQPYVLEADRLYVEAWNQIHEKDGECRLHLEVVPEPFAGPHAAPVVVLQRNPGWSSDGPSEPARLVEARRRYLSDAQAPHLGFLDEFENTAGGWWRPRWRTVREGSGLSYEELARRVLSVEWHGYFSKKWTALPVTLNSQLYGFDLVKAAVARGAVIIAASGLKDWCVAVPELNNHKRCFSTNSPQAKFITAGNLSSNGFEHIIEALGT